MLETNTPDHAARIAEIQAAIVTEFRPAGDVASEARAAAEIDRLRGKR